MIKEHNIRFAEDTIFDDIKKIPLLTKDIIRNNFDELFKFRDNTYYRNTSGGSTGEPVISVCVYITSMYLLQRYYPYYDIFDEIKFFYKSLVRR